MPWNNHQESCPRLANQQRGKGGVCPIYKIQRPIFLKKHLADSEIAFFSKLESVHTIASIIMANKINPEIAYDAQKLHIAVFAAETGRKIQAFDQPLWKNDCLEYYFITPEKKMLQMVIDARGKMSFHIRLQNAIPTDGVTVHSKAVDGKGFWLFVSIPWQKLGISSINPGTKIPFNLCRTRDPEVGSWGKVEKQYAEADSFGILELGKFSSGQGRYQEILINN